ncbi:MAG: hypothetical protein A3H91_06300 [Gammaproteobacteria bacterium RIFCSPLOWO2_02_FULL_61_13]|nr:MAG: hypothetical protein A3H91_06300 [Gammaproteobacteria bacterium RIFCSPLOWO2_02_FULL_61_13]
MLAIGAAVVVALALGFLGTRKQPPAPPATIETLRLALPSLPHAALLHIAAEKGYFVEEGLQLTITPTTHGKVALELVVQRKADLAAAAEVPFVLGVMKGEAIGNAASMLSVSNDSAVVARRDRGIAAPRDLVGKKIGVTLGTSGEYFLWAFMIRHRLAPDSVTLVDIPPDKTAQALVDGSIDAAATWQPIVFDAQTALGKNALLFTEAQAYTLNFLLIGEQLFLKNHPRAIEKFIRAMLKAEQFNRSQPEQALNLVAGRLKVEVDSLRPAWRNFEFQVDLQQSQLLTLEDESRWAMERGYAPAGPVPNFLPHLYLDALLAVKPERVTVVR